MNELYPEPSDALSSPENSEPVEENEDSAASPSSDIALAPQVNSNEPEVAEEINADAAAAPPLSDIALSTTAPTCTEPKKTQRALQPLILLVQKKEAPLGRPPTPATSEQADDNINVDVDDRVFVNAGRVMLQRMLVFRQSSYA